VAGISDLAGSPLLDLCGAGSVTLVCAVDGLDLSNPPVASASNGALTDGHWYAVAWIDLISTWLCTGDWTERNLIVRSSTDGLTWLQRENQTNRKAGRGFAYNEEWIGLATETGVFKRPTRGNQLFVRDVSILLLVNFFLIKISMFSRLDLRFTMCCGTEKFGSLLGLAPPHR
jgi:hypothetical protein